MKKVLSGAIFSTLLLSAAFASSSSISGTVKDSEGAVIAKARVEIHLDSTVMRGNRNSDMVVTTDNNGEFKLEVAPGVYDIFVSFPAFSPQCTKVRVLETKPVIYNPRLQVDPLVINENGDTF